MQGGAVSIVQPVAGVEGQQFDFRAFGQVSGFVDDQAPGLDASLNGHPSRVASSSPPNKPLQPTSGRCEHEAAAAEAETVARQLDGMKTRDMRNDAGILTGFEVSNWLLSRRRAGRIAQGVSGSVVSRWPRRFAWSADTFCAFSVDGVGFLIIEPFGDNNCYWIVAQEPTPGMQPLIERVRSAFAAAWG